MAGSTRTYDANGNLKNAPNGSPLVFDGRNRLSSVALLGGHGNYTYLLNGMGERVGKQQFDNARGTETDTYYVYNEAGQILSEYTRIGRAIQEVQEYVYFGSVPLAVTKSGGTYYYVEADQLGTPRDVIQPGATTASDTVIWKWDYLASNSAFGENAPSVQNITFNLRLPGQYFDSETGFHYNYLRDYEPGTGRYIESDPIGLRGGIDTYAYVSSRPLLRRDPRGLFSIDQSCYDCTYNGGITPDDIRGAAARGCAAVPKKITNARLATCIKYHCEDDLKITCNVGPSECGMSGGSENSGRSWNLILSEGFYNLTQPDSINLCLGNISDSPMPLEAAIIHETAHSCGWHHGDDDGVPHDPKRPYHPPRTYSYEEP